MSVQKKVASELGVVIENGVNNHHRSFVVIAGQNGWQRVHYISQLLQKKTPSSQTTEPTPSVLWCYKKKLMLSSKQDKRQKELDSLRKKGLMDTDLSTALDIFISQVTTWAKYEETEKILGKTYTMLVLQDFDGLTPNILARTVETVRGGGVIILLLEKQSDLDQLYSVADGKEISNHWNNRFLKTITQCSNCVVIDDEFTLLKKISPKVAPSSNPPNNDKLDALKQKVADVENLGPIVNMAYTIDQAEVILQIFNKIADESLNKRIAVTAARGRGKSAALGLSLASAIAYGYTNVFVTAPSAQNVQTLFEFAISGLEALGYQENSDFNIIRLIRNGSDKGPRPILRIEVFKPHRKIICYVKPQDTHFLAQCELLAIDEAAAIPLPLVKNLLGKYNVLLSSTINGYEGTGRSLSLKLFDELRKSDCFTEVKMNAPIRYADLDPIEDWLSSLCCLTVEPPEVTKQPIPAQCNLVQIDRSALFSGDRRIEPFLKDLVSLSVASHYKNEPDDLLLMANAPRHRLFALLGPVEDGKLPLIICYLQVSIEGHIDNSTVADTFNRGKMPSGDLIPWQLSDRYSSPEFMDLFGLRIVRIAVHPDLQSRGYGQEAIKQLFAYYSNKIPYTPSQSKGRALFKRLNEVEPERVDYLGVSFGITLNLFRFWVKKCEFTPVRLFPNVSETTGEHSVIVVRALQEEGSANDFIKTFSHEMMKQICFDIGEKYEDLDYSLLSELFAFSSLSVERKKVTPQMAGLSEESDLLNIQKVGIGRVNATNGTYLMAPLAKLYFVDFAAVKLTRVEQIVLLYMGLMKRSVDTIAEKLGTPVDTVHSAMKKICKAFYDHFCPPQAKDPASRKISSVPK